MRGLRGRRIGAAEWAVLVLVVRNVGGRLLPSGSYLPTNLAVGAFLVVLARRSGSSWSSLGLARRHLGKGLRFGTMAAASAVGVMVAGAVLPLTRELFDDERVDVGAGPGELAYQTLLRIPVGTVAFEELAFRGVLLALLARRMRAGPALAVQSALFGAWHVVPTLSAASANGIEGLGAAGVVVGAVALTTAAGAVFGYLRLRSGHLAAPALLHLAFNDTGYVLAWLART